MKKTFLPRKCYDCGKWSRTTHGVAQLFQNIVRVCDDCFNTRREPKQTRVTYGSLVSPPRAITSSYVNASRIESAPARVVEDNGADLITNYAIINYLSNNDDDNKRNDVSSFDTSWSSASDTSSDDSGSSPCDVGGGDSGGGGASSDW